MERYIGAAYSNGSTFEAKHISALGRPTGGGHIQGNVSDRSVGHGSKGSLESDSRYDGIVQGSKTSESQVSGMSYETEGFRLHRFASRLHCFNHQCNS